MWRHWVLLLLILLPISTLSVSPQHFSYTLKGKVVGIKDGDTIEILSQTQVITVRLAHIDCPEKKQPYGQAARKFLSEKCFGQNVTVWHSNKYDRNKRLIGEVFNEAGENLNKAMVKAGLAWHFIKYSTNTSYAVLEQQAKKQKVGLWSEPNPVPPWKWRN